MSSSVPSSRKVLLAGATGLIGGFLLRWLLADETVSDVFAPVRRNLDVSHPKLHVQRVDFNALPAFPPLDEAYLALGTTIQVAGSQQAFRAVDFEASLAAARAAVQAGARRIGVVSAAGANARSAVFYNRVKGELEDALRQLKLEGLVIARPSLLLNSRSHLGQPPRPECHLQTRVFETARSFNLIAGFPTYRWATSAFAS